MTLLQLHYFQTLSQTLHYTRAAELLHISQPSLSYAISELEKELGVKLFEKKKKQIDLTVYGQQFLPYVERALDLLKEGADVVSMPHPPLVFCFTWRMIRDQPTRPPYMKKATTQRMAPAIQAVGMENFMKSREPTLE